MTHDRGPGGPNLPGAIPPPASPPPPAESPGTGESAGTPESPGSAEPGLDAEDAESGGGAHRAGSAWSRLRARRAEKKQAKAQKPHKKAPWWELPALVVLAIGIAILVKTFVVQPFYIPSASMELTLHGSDAHGHDRILVNKLIYDFR